MAPPFASANADVHSSPLGSGDEPAKRVEAASIPANLGLLVHELKVMLKEKANDLTSTYASALPHGLHGTYYCFRAQGPRKCFFGGEHSGSNNFNLLKRGRNGYYRCHGDQAIAEVARGGGGEPFEGLAKTFSLIYQTEGRILNTGEKKIFFFWDGRGWVEDTCNKVLGVFAAQMGALLMWYEQERLGLFQRIFIDKLSELDPALKTIDKAAMQRYLSDPKWKQIRVESECRVKEELPAIIFNVQDPTVVRKYLQ
jgi:hypothetical protein